MTPSSAPGPAPSRTDRSRHHHPPAQGRTGHADRHRTHPHALGAVLAFAVTGHPSFLNLQIAGWVIMLTGIAGMLLPRRGYGWLRRHLVLRRGPGGRPVVSRAEEQRYPPLVLPVPGRTTVASSIQTPADTETAKQAVAEWEAAEEAASPGAPRPAEEVVEEYVEE